MTMNKILLVLIVASGFLLIFYANNDIFTRKKWLNMFVQTNTETPPIMHHQPLHAADDPGAAQYIEPVTAERRQNNDDGILLLPQAKNPVWTSAGMQRVEYTSSRNRSEHNIFVIYTKENYMLKTKFELFMRSLLKYSSVALHLHVICDRESELGAEEIMRKQVDNYKTSLQYTMYNVTAITRRLDDITLTMMPYFTVPGSQYSDALFFLSLGLHRIVHPSMRRAILIDCDVVFRSDVSRLFDEFSHFSSDHLFGLSPELTPVYYHILYKFRSLNPNTNFGKPYYPAAIAGQPQAHVNSKYGKKHMKHGYPGLNSGVVLLNFDRIRRSKLFEASLRPDIVQRLTRTYHFKGHLGDQDFYTLLGYEHPSIIYRLDCVWNRQLCTWWKEHGYSDIFDTYFRCEGKIRLYHGNCNTRVPE